MNQPTSCSMKEGFRRFFNQSARNMGDQACGFLCGYWSHLKTAIDHQENTFRLAHEALQDAVYDDENCVILTHYASNYAKGLLFELSVLRRSSKNDFQTSSGRSSGSASELNARNHQ